MQTYVILYSFFLETFFIQSRTDYKIYLCLLTVLVCLIKLLTVPKLKHTINKGGLWECGYQINYIIFYSNVSIL